MIKKEPLLSNSEELAFEIRSIEKRSKFSQMALLAIRVIAFLAIFYVIFQIATQVLCFIVLNIPILKITAAPGQQVNQGSIRALKSRVIEGMRRASREHLGFIRPVEMIAGLGIMAIKGVGNRFRPEGRRWEIRNPLSEVNSLFGSYFQYESENQANFDAVRNISRTASKRREIIVLTFFFLALFILIYITYKIVDKLLTTAEYDSYKKLGAMQKRQKFRSFPSRIKGFNED